MPPKKSDFDWLKDHLSDLAKWGSEAGSLHPDTLNEYGLHSGLKLSGLKHAIEVFTPNAAKYSSGGHRFSGSVYIDLFAGSGTTKVGPRDLLAGSSIIASRTRKAFDKAILVEKDSKRATALRDRLQMAGVDMSRVVLLVDDCNQLVDRVIAEAKALGPEPIAFICVDPEGMEINWGTLERINAELPRSDYFIVFTGGAQRVVNAHLKRGTHGESLRSFTGLDDVSLLALSGKDLFDTYQGKIQVDLGKTIGDSVPIKDDRGQDIYKILLFVTPTFGGSPFFRGYSAMFSRLRGVDVSNVKVALDILKRGQSTLQTAQ